ncbi:hypothetical protein Q8A73_011432 [Channa argus]|nr:hypothetical protein Q8A73_011432 [Channa argus]
MKLLLLLLLTLSSASLCSSTDNTEPDQVLNPSLGHRVPEITSVEWTERDEALLTGPKNRNKRSLSPSLNEFTLEWQTWTGSLPNGAVSIYNGYVKRYYFVCKYKCEAGFYNPYMGNYCHYPYADKEHLDSQFDILVNKDNFEFTEWKEGSYGSVPPYSVKTCSDRDKYVAKNQYGLGKMQVMHEAFFLPWVDKEYWYKTYQVLTVNRDIFSEQITDVKYKIDGAENIKYPPEIVKTSSLINYECREYAVPPNHSCTVKMVAYKYKANVPFTARLSRTYSNKETTWTSISGIYNSVQVGDVRVVVERCEPLPDGNACATKLTHSGI